MVGKSVSGPPPEITITLTNILCPKVARGPQQTDEPFAWAAREFLRKLCIGKQVTFRVTQSVPSINRTFGEVELAGEKLSVIMVREGYASVKENRDSQNIDEYNNLLELEQAAKNAKIGMYTDIPEQLSKKIRDVQWTAPLDYFEALHDRMKGKSIRIIIEYIRDGSSFRALYLDTMTYFTGSLTGVISPRLNTPKQDSGVLIPIHSFIYIYTSINCLLYLII